MQGKYWQTFSNAKPLRPRPSELGPRSPSSSSQAGQVLHAHLLMDTISNNQKTYINTYLWFVFLVLVKSLVLQNIIHRKVFTVGLTKKVKIAVPRAQNYSSFVGLVYLCTFVYSTTNAVTIFVLFSPRAFGADLPLVKLLGGIVN